MEMFKTRDTTGAIFDIILSKKSGNSKIVDGMESVKLSYRTQKNCSLLIIWNINTYPIQRQLLLCSLVFFKCGKNLFFN